MKEVIRILSLITLCLGLYSCNWEGPYVDSPRFTTTVNDELEYNLGYSINTSVINCRNVEECGFCISESPEPTLLDKVVICEKEYSYSVEYSVVLTDLEVETIYYVRPFIKNKYGVVYGEQVIIETEKDKMPAVETDSVLQFDYNSIIVISKVYNCSVYLDDKGVCYSTIQKEPTLENSCKKRFEWGASDDFEVIINEEVEYNTTYYIRSYIRLGSVVLYGNVVEYKTNLMPEMELVSVDALTSSSAVVIGQVKSNGNTVYSRGIYYSEFEYTSDDSKNEILPYNGIVVEAETEGENFMLTMENLESGKTYYIYPFIRDSYGDKIWASTVLFTMP